jgi:hypothetical protein
MSFDRPAVPAAPFPAPRFAFADAVVVVPVATAQFAAKPDLETPTPPSERCGHQKNHCCEQQKDSTPATPAILPGAGPDAPAHRSFSKENKKSSRGIVAGGSR